MKSARTLHVRVCLIGLLGCAGVPAAGQQSAPPVPVTLQQAVRTAVDDYPSIRASLANVAAGEAGVDLAGTAYLPRMTATMQANRATRNNVPGLLLPGYPIPGISGPAADASSGASTWGSTAGLLFSWEPFDFGYRGATVDSARARVNQASAVAGLTRLEVGVATAEAFLRLIAAEETARAAEANVERMEVFANAVGVLVTNQLRPGADDSRARAELAAARIQLIQAEQEEQLSRTALARWLGLPAADLEVVSAPQLQMPSPAPVVPPNLALHPLANAQMRTVESSRARQVVLDRAYCPRFYLDSSVYARGTGARVDGTYMNGLNGLAPTTPNWAVGLSVEFPLFDFFSLREEVRIEQQVESREMARYDQVVLELNSEVEQARAALEGARRIVENTPVQLDAARVLEQQARARYDAGLATIVEVADAQRLLFQAEIDDALARLGVWRARVQEAAARGDISEFMAP